MRFTVFVCAALALLAAPYAAHAQNLPSQAQGVILLDAIAARGPQCGLLRPWQAAALRAQTIEQALGWSAEARAQVAAQTKARIDATTCEDEMMRVWIDGAQRGMESEMLSHFIIAYRAFALMDAPPLTFTSAAQRTDFSDAVPRIDAKLAELAASGAVPEGGGPWPAFVERTSAGAADLAAVLAGAPRPGARDYAPDRAAAWVAQSAIVTELWLADAP